MMTIELAALETVTGGAAPAGDNAFGRCGPGTGMSYLGNVYTPECAAHDASVRASQANGDSKIWSHLQALPKLPAAIGSYIKAVA